MSTNECLRVIREAGEMGVEHIGFSGGEPLFREDIFDLMSEAREYGIKLSLVTNGALIGEKKAKRLKNLDVFVYLSVDGLRKNHELVRGKGSWKYTKGAIKEMNKAGVDYSTITALNRLNYVEIKDIVEFSLIAGARYACFIPIMPFGRATWEDVLTKEEILKSLKLIDEVAKERDFPISLWCMPFALRFIDNFRVHVGCCRRADVMDIGVNGDVLLCDVLDIVLTSVKNKPLLKAFLEQENHELSLKVSNPNLNKPCSNCRVRKRCLGGCYARSLSKFGKLNEKDPLCPVDRID